MAVASSTAALLGAAVTLAGTAVGTWSAVSRQEEQRKQAEFAADMARRNAQIAEENARMAEEEAGQARADSYDAAVRKRQETALLIGRQRAQAGASGAQIDSGSHLDSQLDLGKKGSWMPCPSRNRGSAPPTIRRSRPGTSATPPRGPRPGNASCAAKAARTTFPWARPCSTAPDAWATTLTCFRARDRACPKNRWRGSGLRRCRDAGHRDHGRRQEAPPAHVRRHGLRWPARKARIPWPGGAASHAAPRRDPPSVPFGAHAPGTGLDALRDSKRPSSFIGMAFFA